MPQATKIATCCYCGTRAALVLRGIDRHELCCASCGAPLHNLKMLPVQDAKPRNGNLGSMKSARAVAQPKPLIAREKQHGDTPRKRKKQKRRKGLANRLLEEAFDLIEDIFD